MIAKNAVGKPYGISRVFQLEHQALAQVPSTHPGRIEFLNQVKGGFKF